MQVTIVTVDTFDCDVEIDDAFDCDVEIDNGIKASRIDDEQPCFENSTQEEEETGKVRGRRG